MAGIYDFCFLLILIVSRLGSPQYDYSLVTCLVEKDVRLVLAELGRPEELAEGYQPDKDRCLIGAPYYRKYKMTLRLVLAALTAGLLTAGGMTLAFAFMQRKSLAMESLTGGDWEQHAVPGKRRRRKGEEIAGMVFSVFFLTVFLATPGIIGGIFEVNGQMRFIPMLDIGALRQAWYLIVLFFLAGIGRDIFRMTEERNTRRRLLVTGVCDLFSAVCTVIWLTGYQMVSPVFLDYVKIRFEGEQITIGSSLISRASLWLASYLR